MKTLTTLIALLSSLSTFAQIDCSASQARVGKAVAEELDQYIVQNIREAYFNGDVNLKKENVVLGEVTQSSDLITINHSVTKAEPQLHFTTPIQIFNLRFNGIEEDSRESLCSWTLVTAAYVSVYKVETGASMGNFMVGEVDVLVSP
jgi:hypothetical protein